MVQLKCVHMLQEAYEGLLLILMRSLDLSTLYAAACRDAGHTDGLNNICACTFLQLSPVCVAPGFLFHVCAAVLELWYQ
jgi:hypothetical protein